MKKEKVRTLRDQQRSWKYQLDLNHFRDSGVVRFVHSSNRQREIKMIADDILTYIVNALGMTVFMLIFLYHYIAQTENWIPHKGRTKVPLGFSVFINQSDYEQSKIEFQWKQLSKKSIQIRIFNAIDQCFWQSEFFLKTFGKINQAKELRISLLISMRISGSSIK